MKPELKFETETVLPPVSTDEVAKTEKTQKPPKGRWLSSHYPQKATRPLRQAELCLESVKVIRNDLRDSDIDIVPMRHRHGASASRSAAAAAELFRPVSSPISERQSAGVFAVPDKKGGAKSDATDLFGTNHASKSAAASPAEEGSAMCAAPKRTGYLGLSILTRWFGLGRGRAY